MASTQQQRETAEEISEAFVEAYNTGDTSLVEPVVTDDFEMEEELLIVEGDRGATRIRWGGRHTDSFQGIPGTGEEVDTTSVVLTRMEDGKLAEMWVYNDTMGFLRQLGIDPTPVE